jgi:hypothetical protein
LLAFSDERQAGEAVVSVESDYLRHQRAARVIAAEFFATQRVLRSLLERIGLM